MKIQTKIKPLLTITLSLGLVSLLSPVQVFGDPMCDNIANQCRVRCTSKIHPQACLDNCNKICDNASSPGTTNPQTSPEEKKQAKSTNELTQTDPQTTKPANDKTPNPTKAK